MTEAKAYLNIKDIQRTFGIPYQPARKAFKLADQIDDEELGDFRIYDSKVRKTTVCRVMGMNPNDISNVSG